MRARAPEQGFTLLETLIAMAILLIGALGMGTVFSTGLRMNGDARRMTRATAIAQDLVSGMALWPYGEGAGAPLANKTTTNDGDVGDSAFAFQVTANPLAGGIADHGEADLTALGARWTGLPASALDGGYERYWNVRYVDTNGDGTNDLAEIAVVVRWPHAGGWRRIVLMTAKTNPAAR